MTRRIEGEVLKLCCDSCASEFPTLELSGDADYLTSGLATVSCPSQNEVALSALASEEHSDTTNGYARFAKRLSDQLGREFAPVARITSSDKDLPAGTTFQEFSETYKRRRLSFLCPVCRGEARVIARQSPSDFVDAGGVITLVGDIELI